MSRERWAESVWYGAGPTARTVRAALAPLGALFGGVVAVRGRLFDRGVLATNALPVPAVSVGNLTVGGTGKTPVAAWIVRELMARGARPAVLLRGVGGDEALVHALLNPDAPVVADADRVRGARTAVRRGADVLVLDDAFQHRRARRDADIVLVAAETFDEHARLLPAGPFREPLTALRRATTVVVTRKSAASSHARAVAAQLTSYVARGAAAVAVAHLEPASLVRWMATRDTAALVDTERASAITSPVSTLTGVRVLAIAGIGAPDAFAAQLRAVGAMVDLARFPDHHAYDARDVRALVERSRYADRIVTTLKDAVKLGPLWTRHAGALWYVTQRVTLETGAPALVDVLDAVATAARAAAANSPHRTAPESAVRGRHA